jgi:hypothetical protein
MGLHGSLRDHWSNWRKRQGQKQKSNSRSKHGWQYIPKTGEDSVRTPACSQGSPHLSITGKASKPSQTLSTQYGASKAED